MTSGQAASLKFWGVASALLLAYGVWALARVASAYVFADTQRARVLACNTRPAPTGGFPVGPMSNELIVTVTAEYEMAAQPRRHQFKFSRPVQERFDCSDVPEVPIRISPLDPSSVYAVGFGSLPDDFAKGAMAIVVGSLFAAGVRQRYL
jgi:hypothetical protein